MSCTFHFPKAPEHLLDALHDVIPNCELLAQQLPETPISLWLIPPVFPTDKLDDEVIRRIWNDTPYWIFCWASGLAMAQWLLAEPQQVKDKVVLDFGAGSGVVAIAAKMAGAKRVICCDIDQVSLDACRVNAELNDVVDEATPSPLEFLDQAVTAEEIQQAIAQLPVRQQQAFMLRAWEGFDTQTTAQIMNCTEGSVKTHYHRAIQALRNSLAHMNPYLGGSSE